MSVIIFTQPGCGPCRSVKRRLHGLGIAFEERNLATDDTAREFLVSLGIQSTPVVVASGVDPIVGMREDELSALADYVRNM